MENNMQHPNTCMCGSCSNYMKFHILRWILGLIIIFMIFSFGVRIGEFKNELENNENMNMIYGESHGIRFYNTVPFMSADSGQVQMMPKQAGSGVTINPTTKVLPK